MNIELFKQVIAKELQHFLNEETLFVHDIKLHEYFEANPNNTNFKEVTLKLHQAFSDEAYGPYAEDIAHHIINLKIDNKIASGDLSIVESIAEIISKGKTWNLLGFASKYCNFHNINAFPIYNSQTLEVLKSFLSITKIEGLDLNNYLDYSEALSQFRDFINATMLNYKELDKFIWLHKITILSNYKKQL